VVLAIGKQAYQVAYFLHCYPVLLFEILLQKQSNRLIFKEKLKKGSGLEFGFIFKTRHLRQKKYQVLKIKPQQNLPPLRWFDHQLGLL
jgi:hypothetical protein